MQLTMSNRQDCGLGRSGMRRVHGTSCASPCLCVRRGKMIRCRVALWIGRRRCSPVNTRAKRALRRTCWRSRCCTERNDSRLTGMASYWWRTWRGGHCRWVSSHRIVCDSSENPIEKLIETFVCPVQPLNGVIDDTRRHCVDALIVPAICLKVGYGMMPANQLIPRALHLISIQYTMRVLVDEDLKATIMRDVVAIVDDSLPCLTPIGCPIWKR